uniref:Uncharacterized protein n=1 Tax=Callorhinchus milii TaxID=7868 RepID=A0A4W3JMB4_CALMI
MRRKGSREMLTQAQRMVEMKNDGQLHRISIYDPLEIISEDDLTAQEIVEYHSNTENTERPQLKSKRVKNKVKKKEATVQNARGAPPQTANTFHYTRNFGTLSLNPSALAPHSLLSNPA